MNLLFSIVNSIFANPFERNIIVQNINIIVVAVAGYKYLGVRGATDCCKLSNVSATGIGVGAVLVR